MDKEMKILAHNQKVIVIIGLPEPVFNVECFIGNFLLSSVTLKGNHHVLLSFNQFKCYYMFAEGIVDTYSLVHICHHSFLP